MPEFDETQSLRYSDHPEEALEIPLERINPETLRRMVEEFVTREWSELADSGYTLNDKIEQVILQLKDGSARVVYDLTTESWNIVANR